MSASGRNADIASLSRSSRSGPTTTTADSITGPTLKIDWMIGCSRG